MSLVSGAEGCTVDIGVSSEGITENTAGFSISPGSGYYYPQGGEWTLGIPIQGRNVRVVDGEGDSLDVSVSNSSDLFKAVSFRNDERVSDTETYRFEISYEMPRGVILYDGSGYMEQYLPMPFCNDRKNVSVDYPRAWALQNSSIQVGTKSSESITLQNTYEDTFRLAFKGKYGYSPVRNYSEGIFNVSVPSRYSKYVLSKIGELSTFNNDMEEQTGIDTPNSFHVAYLPFDSSKISEEASGQYYGGRIEIKSTQLSESELQHMETLTHELVHGYNDRLSSDSSPDWWWEEGTAEYVSHKVLEQNGYNVSALRPSETRVRYSFENCDFERSFIGDWSPVDETGFVQVDLYPCSDGLPTVTIAGSSQDQAEDSKNIDPVTDRDRLGYKYSELIVAEIFDNNSKTVADVYEIMLEKNVTFSESRVLMNNQINYFASKALNQDMTEFFREKEISVDGWGYEEKQLLEAENRLEEINSSYPRFQVFHIYFQELENIRNSFYAGRFGEVKQVSRVVNNAEKRNRTLFQTLGKFKSVREHVRGLEAKYKPEFFSNQLQEVNATLNLIKDAEFNKAETSLTEIKNQAEEKKKNIEDAENKTEKLARKIEGTNLLVKPFLMDASGSLAKAEKSLQRGELEQAQREIKASQNRVENAPFFASIFYIFFLMGTVYLWRALRKENPA